MGKVKAPKTLFFIKGINATADELAEIENLQPGVEVRSAAFVVPGAPVEPFDRVAGTVPPDYADSDGKPRPVMTRRERRAVERAKAQEADAPPERRKKAAVPLKAPSIAEGTDGKPQGFAWGAAPAAAPPQAPAAPARPVWRPNA